MEQNSRNLEKSFDKIAELYDEETNTFHHKICSFLTLENDRKNYNFCQ